MKNTEILTTLQLLSNISSGEKFDSFLSDLVELIQKWVKVDSCLIYMYDRDQKILKLIGTNSTEKINLKNVSLKEGEGITGWVASHKQVVVIARKAYADPRFRAFDELPQDKYEAFCSLPIILNDQTIGVINLQNIEPYNFSKEEIDLLEALIHIVAFGFEKAMLERQVEDLTDQLATRKLVDRAKSILMERENLSEAEAHKLIQNNAMKNRKSLKEVAEAILLVWG